MTPAFTRSALNKGIQMKEVKRYDGKVGHSPDGGYVNYEDYAALQQKLIALGKELGVLKQFKVAYEWWQEKTDWVQKDKRFDVLVPWGKHRADVMREYIEHLEQQLTATTNSLTNAQEALKSAGIEADTVQAGVVELVSRMNQVAAENYDLKHPGTYLPSKRETPATDAYLNAVRAEGVDKAIEHLHNKFASTGHVGVPVMALEWLSAELRVGNAGKDGSHD